MANHISLLGKRDFEVASRIVLSKAFGLICINIDGKGDGGTDFITVDDTGKRSKVAYQITTQKSDIKNKAYKDAKKSLEKLNINKYYFLCTYNLSEVESRSLEMEIENELDVRAYVFTPTIISGLLISYNLVACFLDEIGYPSLRPSYSTSVDFKQMALHSYTLLSSEAKFLKEQIYDDTILLILSDFPDGIDAPELVARTSAMLNLSDDKLDRLTGRVDSLLSKQRVIKSSDGLYSLSTLSKVDLDNRKSLYERELAALSSAQTDVLREYNVDWTTDDARLASVWISNSIMSSQLAILDQADIPLASNFVSRIGDGMKDLERHLLSKGVASTDIGKVIDDFRSIALTQPLMRKLSSAFVYVALEGKNPMTSCRALGVSNWNQMKLLIEPTMGIPLLCSYLFAGSVNRIFDSAINAIHRARELEIPLHISYNYIKECAGHLHMAKKYDGLDFGEDEMIYSSNAFVSNYYALKKQGVKVPKEYIEYLSLFSPAIKFEQDYKKWIRSLMTDIQSLFTQHGGVLYVDLPLYEDENLEDVKSEFESYLEEKHIDKSYGLLMNDVNAVKFTQDKCAEGEHWMILTNDKVLINVAKKIETAAWITTPIAFLDMVEISKPMSERDLLSLVHSMAQYSESTLAYGARILDKIIYYASEKMQDWEFKQAISKFKKELLDNLSGCKDAYNEIDRRTDDFLKSYGISLTNDADSELEPNN